MADTPRLALPNPVGTDLIANGDNIIASMSAILDNAAMYAHGTLAARPAAATLGGKFYLADDVGILYLSNTTTWIEVTRGSAEVPLGALLDYIGSADPTDTRFILADGRAISRSTYSALFALVGVAFGPGNGTTTFNIPDLRGRSTVGPDNMGTAQGGAGRMATNNTLAASGGTETTVLSIGNLPAHDHNEGSLVTNIATAHDHAVGTIDVSTTGAHTHGVGTYSVGSESAHTHGVGTYAVAGSGVLATGTESADHSHTFSGSGGTSADGAHTHIPENGQNFATTQTATVAMGSGGTARYLISSYSYLTSSAGSHTHSVTVSGSTAGRSVSHTHSIATHGHTFSGSSAAGSSHTHGLTGSSSSNGDHKHVVSGSTASNGAHSHLVTGNVGSTGSGTAFKAMGPYVVVNKIVRVL